ncbi:putative two component system histidine kinase/response regulator fusion protein [Pedobacter sp. BAL39]|uniref:sensor histidine kinase n=1 Tax=Pedobacter sp. BAL39 TaxID=391596 RepID=UPI000155A16E|nr:HAMP domain-containing sensor histidine kinase [Pedobacter sp. BAL39]EDM35149.1 putative two component system histidine kinase/response regulator fusion protein [Pedobacter sp. BAL39]
MSGIKNLFVFLTEYDQSIRIEYRMFNVMCLIAVLTVAASIPFTIFIGLHSTSLILLAMLLALMFIYFLARFRRRYTLAILLVATCVPALLCVNFFYSAGIMGSTLPSLVLTLFLVLIVIGRKFSILLTAICLISGMVIIATEYFHPELLAHTVINRRSIYIGTAYTHLFSVCVIFFGIYHLRRIYYKEKMASDHRATQLELINEEKNKLFSIVAHDLRAPLASIQGYMQLLKVYDIQSDERETMESKLTEALSGTQQMLDNLLSWSRSQLTSMTAVLGAHRMVTILTPMLQMQQAMALEKGLTFDVTLPEEVGAYCDADMLQLVVRNLLGNAIKFTPVGGSVRFIAEQGKNDCLLIVTDTGIGIPAEKSSTIFSLKTKSTFGTDNEKGIGLGLYLCKEYTLLQNGKIWFEQNKVQGTTFYVSLPLTPAAPQTS